MGKLRPNPKRKGRWSQETIRRRGVRAVVAAMRLNKECQQLRREHACHLEETIILRRYVEKIRAVNKSLRELLRRRMKQKPPITSNGNSWMNNGHPG